MSSSSFLSSWLKYLAKRDTISKSLIAISLVAGIIWYLSGYNPAFGKLAGFLLLGSIVFSLLFYLIVGKIQERSEMKFYDAIYSDCDWTSPYQGRDMKRIKVNWFFLWPRMVTVFAESNSRAGTSQSGWRAIKLSASDSFLHRGEHLLTSFAGHRQGKLSFAFLNDSEMATPASKAALIEEGLHDFAYENLHDYGRGLPRIVSASIGNDAKGEAVLETSRIEFSKQMSSYDKELFESNFRQRYENSLTVWVFKWDFSSVEVTSVARGSQEERRLKGEKVITALIANAVRSAFSLYSTEEYSFHEESIQWSNDGKKVESFVIDFLQSDISMEQRVEDFERYMVQGLEKIFRDAAWKFDWEVDGFTQLVTISHQGRW